MYYFEHDTLASADGKIMELRLEFGGAAVDAFWTILEQIYRDEKPLAVIKTDSETKLVTKSVSHRLCVDENTFSKWVNYMVEIGLLEIDAENPSCVTSKRAIENIERYRHRQEVARQNGKNGGRKPKTKPNKNQVGLQPETKVETNNQANKTKQNVSFGLDKPNQNKTYVASSESAAGGPASSDAYCPLCDTKLWKDRQSGRYRCDSCQDAFAPEKVVWK